jgi:uncharacterized protein (DUF2236 family)
VLTGHCQLLSRLHQTADVEFISRLNPRTGIADAASSLFAHADYPLANSLNYPDDPGLFGPLSVTWHVVGDVSTFIGGIRALLIQAAHPEVAAGVVDHSVYESDPLGRLSRTSSYVTATSYGAMPEVHAALQKVRIAHVGVAGVSHRTRPYSASGGMYAAWVHNVLADSFLAAYEVFGPRVITGADSDRYVREQADLGVLVQASDLPETRSNLARWISQHPDVDSSPGMVQTVAFLRNPPLPPTVLPAYRILFQAAASTVPSRIAEILGIKRYAWSLPSGNALTKALRWSLGASPSWQLALERTGGVQPQGVSFLRPPPIGTTHDQTTSP